MWDGRAAAVQCIDHDRREDRRRGGRAGDRLSGLRVATRRTVKLRRALVNLGILGLALWAALGLAVNVRHLQWRQAEDRWLDDEPCLWRYGTPPTERLERFLETAGLDARNPGPVLFSSRWEGQGALCAYLWATYLLPEATLRRAPSAGAVPGRGRRDPGGVLRLHYDPPRAGARVRSSSPPKERTDR